ncbi:MAG: cbb3-type cytochrome c oxidase subunit 3 [Balneolales bacterium]|nr:cbb3-type cytochrome c oxidase subunit 3 [Balneolales bacterium]
MYKEVLRSMEGVEVFPSISLILFFVFFIVLVGYMIRTGKRHWEHAAHLPLETDEPEILKTTES